MKSIYLRLPDGDPALETGAVMVRAHLEAKGHKIVRNKTHNYDVILCWGCGTRDPLVKGVPALNGKVNSFNKLTAIERFQEHGVLTPRIVPMNPELGPWEWPSIKEAPLPWFARKISHAKGKDIHLCEAPKEVIATYHARTHDFFSVYVPHTRELRAWVFRDKVFAAYHKHYRQPGLENYKNLEFRSELVDYLCQDRKFTNSAVKATESLNMDFGAVDILEGKDGNYYVLEVNSMPEISSMIRVSGIRLANLISDWAQAQ